MGYVFSVGPEVVGGPGSLGELPRWASRRHVTHPLIITDPVLEKTGAVAAVQAVLPGANVVACVTGEPTTQMAELAAGAAREQRADLLIGLGGGSSIDVAKLAGLLIGGHTGLAELASDWNRVTAAGPPLVAIPTTVGSGSEMTRGAVFKDTGDAAKKLVIVSDHLWPALAVLDSGLLAAVPTSVIAATGCDALTQGVEGVLSTAATPWTNALHLHGVNLIRDHFGRALGGARDLDALGAMQAAAAMIGAGLALSGVGAVHAIANTVGGRFAIPHGVACAMLLMPVLRYTGKKVPDRFAPLEPAVGLPAGGGAVNAVLAEVAGLVSQAGMNRRLGEFGVRDADVPVIAAEAAGHSDMATSPARPDAAAIEEMLTQVL